MRSSRHYPRLLILLIRFDGSQALRRTNQAELTGRRGSANLQRREDRGTIAGGGRRVWLLDSQAGLLLERPSRQPQRLQTSSSSQSAPSQQEQQARALQELVELSRRARASVAASVQKVHSLQFRPAPAENREALFAAPAGVGGLDNLSAGIVTQDASLARWRQTDAWKDQMEALQQQLLLAEEATSAATGLAPDKLPLQLCAALDRLLPALLNTSKRYDHLLAADPGLKELDSELSSSHFAKISWHSSVEQVNRSQVGILSQRQLGFPEEVSRSIVFLANTQLGCGLSSPWGQKYLMEDTEDLRERLREVGANMRDRLHEAAQTAKSAQSLREGRFLSHLSNGKRAIVTVAVACGVFALVLAWTMLKLPCLVLAAPFKAILFFMKSMLRLCVYLSYLMFDAIKYPVVRLVAYCRGRKAETKDPGIQKDRAEGGPLGFPRETYQATSPTRSSGTLASIPEEGDVSACSSEASDRPRRASWEVAAQRSTLGPGLQEAEEEEEPRMGGFGR